MKFLQKKSLYIILIGILLFSSIPPITIQANTLVSDPLVTITENHVNKAAGYQITFRVNSELKRGNQDNDKIMVSFPAGFQLPSTVSSTNIKINDLTLDAGAGNVVVNLAARQLEIPLPSNHTIPAGGFVKVEISSTAGIVNPSIAGTYALELSTSKEPTPVPSSTFSIQESMISIPEVTVTPNIVNQAGTYFIRFRTSSKGALVTGDKMYIEFPAGTTLPASIQATRVKVNERDISVAPVVSGNLLELTIPSGVTINNSEEVRISILKEANILNPSVNTQYSLRVRTSKDTVFNTSTQYSIETAMNKLEAWVSPNIVGQAAQYTIGLTNGQQVLASCTDTITIRFPNGSELPAAIDQQKVYINGQALHTLGSCSSSLVTLDRPNRSVTILLPSTVNIQANQFVSILLDASLGIKNPLLQGDYQLEIKSSKEPAYLSSQKYSVGGSYIDPLTVQLLDNGVSKDAEYLIQFSTSNTGGLVGGQGKIYLRLPNGTTVPSSISRTAIKINDKVLTSNATSSNNTVEITIPSDLQIPVNSNGKQNIKLEILPAAGIKNPSTPGEYKLSLYTSRDPVALERSYTIGLQVSTPSVALSPNQYNQAGQYSIAFTTSSQGRLDGSSSVNDFIEIMFPSGTGVPGTIAAAQVLINGQTAKSVTVSGQSVKVFIPTNMVIENNSAIGLVIQAGAGVRTPTAGSYQLKVRTSQDFSYRLSTTYSTVGTSGTTPTTPNPNTPGTITGSRMTLEASTLESNRAAKYTISYTTGSSESLVGGTDDLHLMFHTYVQTPSFINRDQIKVNNVALDTGVVTIKNNTITFRLPNNVNVGSNQTLTITIEETANIKHPAYQGTYTLYGWSSKNTSYGLVSYTLNTQGSHTLAVTPTYDTQSRITSYSLVYRPDSTNLLGGMDWVSILIPSAIRVSQEIFKQDVAITVNGYTVNSNHIQVSGQDLSFTIPAGLTISSTNPATITILDPNQHIAPSYTGNYRFQISTSKNNNRVSSNEIQFLVAGNAGGHSGSNSGSGSGNNNGTNPTNPGNQSTQKSTIVLYLDKTDAYVDANRQTLDAAPRLINGTTMVPIRFISEQLGAQVNYRADQKRVDIWTNDTFVSLILDSATVYTTNGQVKLDAPAQVVNGRTFVPIRFVSEQLGMYVKWSSREKSITIIEK